ncbi:hypothetical protein [Amycolatopsis thailandensis]|uniref:hypothetical protein n=1 Tax=Amycolatopsis thailandensis TaxID=589330 RepID=UPI003632BA44
MDDPFDARKVMLNDHERPFTSWRTVSLVTALRSALMRDTGSGSPEAHDQATYLRQITDELTARGLDGDSLVRFGLGPELASAVLGQAMPYWLPALRVVPGPAAEHDPDPEPEPPWPHPQTWESVLGPLLEAEKGLTRDLDASRTNIEQVVGAVMSMAYPWALSAPLDDLLALKPPSVEQLRSARQEPRPDTSVLEEYRWIINRFAETHLSDWSTPSLHREHKWRAGHYPAPCPESLMPDRDIVDHDLNAEIARRAVDAGPSTTHAGRPAGLNRTMLSKLSMRALDLLRIGRTRDAAALFEFALNESPHDAELLNNLGFCLIPDDPRAALSRLEEAIQRGYEHIAINLYNRALCRLLLGDLRGCIYMITEAWPLGEGELASLWSPGPHGLKLAQPVDTQHELARLAHRAASTLGDLDAAEYWSAIVDRQP